MQSIEFLQKFKIFLDLKWRSPKDWWTGDSLNKRVAPGLAMFDHLIGIVYLFAIWATFYVLISELHAAIRRHYHWPDLRNAIVREMNTDFYAK